MSRILGEIVLPNTPRNWSFNDTGGFQPVCVPIIDHINTVTTESTEAEDIYVSYIQPDTFLEDGDEIYVSYFGKVEESGNPKQINVLFSGNNIYSDTLTDFSFETFRLDLAIWRGDSDTLYSECVLYFDSGVRVVRNSATGLDFTDLNTLVFSATTFLGGGEITMYRAKGIFRPHREVDIIPPPAPYIWSVLADSDTEITVNWQEV